MKFIASLSRTCGTLNDTQLHVIMGEFGGEGSGAFFTPKLPHP